MKRLFTKPALLLAALSVAFLSGCSKDPVRPGTIDLPTDAEKITFTTEDGLNKNITFTATSDWDVVLEETTKTTPEWLTVSPMNGKAGSATLSVTLTETNTTGAERTATITIRPSGGTAVTISVTQAPDLILPKKLTTLSWIEDPGDEPSITTFSYDNQGRTIIMAGISVDYTVANQVKLTMDKVFEPGHTYEARYTITLKDGRAATFTGWDREIYTPGGIDEREEFANDYTYDKDGQLSKQQHTKPAAYTVEYAWKDGNIQSLESTDGDFRATLEYTTQQPNNLNIDTWAYLSAILFGQEDYARFLNLAGKRSAMLPSKIAYTEEGESASITLEYTTDTNGYITRITMTSPDGPTDISVLTLEYEE